nr:hypothetical protein [Mycoplasmopsis bovis]
MFIDNPVSCKLLHLLKNEPPTIAIAPFLWVITSLSFLANSSLLASSSTSIKS